jgi:methyl-accepting chemotaxis protein
MQLTTSIKLPAAQPASRAVRDLPSPPARGLGDLYALAVVGVLLLAPIIAFTWYAMLEQREERAAAQSQLAATEYGTALSRFLLAASAYRTAEAATALGEPASAKVLADIVSDANAAAAEVDGVDALHGESFGVAGRWAALREHWTKLRSDRPDAEQGGDSSLGLIEEGSSLLAALTVYAQDRAGVGAHDPPSAMPQLRELVAASIQLGALRAQGSAFVRARQVSFEQRDAFARTIAHARVALDEFAAGSQLRSGAGGQRDGKDGAAALQAARQVLSVAERDFMPGQLLPVEPGPWSAAAMRAIEALNAVAASLSQRSREAAQHRLDALQDQALVMRTVVGVLTGLAIVGMLVYGRRLVKSGRDRDIQTAREAAENRRNQAAIRRLMEELSVIEKGNLTAQATVTEDITGAIADTINLTVGQLRKIVTDINRAAGQVSTATTSASAGAQQLIAAATRQAQDIEAADVSVEMITHSMAEVSTSANQSADVARRTLETTERGTRAVQNSMGGMNQIRQQIQETSKRIKRLGESSQQIGQIVEVITDLAEQTDVLALNAAIQAAAAGEAGKAFAVVAEEVQLLAERSADATTQIALLVKTIQSDTQEAVASMERSIQGVVEGARLSDAAGQALKEIENVTRDLAEMIQAIAVSTETQVVMAGEVRSIMRDVLSVTGSATERTQRTSTSIGQMAELTDSLKHSVAQFKVA